MTKRGWVAAHWLEAGDCVLKKVSYGKVDCKYHVSLVREEDLNLWPCQRALVEDRTCILRKGLFESVRWACIINNDGEDEQKVCIGEDEEKQSDVESEGEREAKVNAQKDRSQTSDSRWQRQTSIKSSDSVEKSSSLTKMEDGVCYLNEECEREGYSTSDTLQDRSGSSGVTACCRSGREVAQLSSCSCGRRKERAVLAWVGVDSVEIHERGCSEEFEQLCPEGLVYNLEVERYGTYVAADYIVHNCHHIRGGGEWHSVLYDLDSRYKIGLSATAFVDSNVEQGRGAIWMLATCGEVRMDLPVSRLVEEGYLMRQHVQLYPVRRPTTYQQHKWSRTMHARCIVENRWRNQLIAQIAAEHVEKGRKVLVIAKQLAHIAALHEALDDVDLRVGRVVGKTSSAERQWAIESLEEGGLDVLLGNVLSEGIDLPCVNVVINAEGGKDDKVTVQRQRNLTIADGKTEAIFVDFLDETNPHLLKHSKARRKMYESESEFEVEVVE